MKYTARQICQALRQRISTQQWLERCRVNYHWQMYDWAKELSNRMFGYNKHGFASQQEQDKINNGLKKTWLLFKK